MPFAIYYICGLSTQFRPLFITFAACPPNPPRYIGTQPQAILVLRVGCDVSGDPWSRGVTVSTLDSESSDRGSNPRGTSMHMGQIVQAWEPSTSPSSETSAILLRRSKMGECSTVFRFDLTHGFLVTGTGAQ